MKDLKYYQDKFENVNVNGDPIEIVALLGGVECSLLVVTDGTTVTTYPQGGRHPLAGASLVPKRAVLPKDILCSVWNDGGECTLRFSDGEGGFYVDGLDSRLGGLSQQWSHYTVLEQGPVPWFNDSSKCPVPDGLTYRVFISGMWSPLITRLPRYHWLSARGESPITAYQIMGEA